MSKSRFLLAIVSLLLASAVLVLPATAQTISPVGVGERVLVMLTPAQPAVAYEFDNEAESDTTMIVSYLGQSFPLLAEWYDSNGALLGSITITEAGPARALRLPADIITIVVSGAGGATGRATFSLTVDAPASVPADSAPGSSFDGPFGEPPETMADDRLIYDDSVIVPQSGEWLLSYANHTNTCPNEISLEDMWMPAESTTHRLSFSGALEALALELHQMVAPDEIAAEPTFFEIYENDLPNSWTVLPGIQTAPYEYRYTVIAPDYVEVEYIERLALTDCELRAHYDLTLQSASGAPGGTRGRGSRGVDLSNWTTIGGATAPTLESDAFAPEGVLCAADRVAGAETWFFHAPEEFVEQIQNGYGRTLEYYLRLDRAERSLPDYDVELGIGNGIMLVHYFGYAPTTDWTRFEIPLTAGAGWLDLDGMISTDDPATFEELLAYATQLRIRGDFAGSDSACIARVSLR